MNKLSLGGLGVLGLLLCVGCARETFEERVERLRSGYTATVNPGGFVVRQTPPMGMPGAKGEMEATGAEPAAGAEPATGEKPAAEAEAEAETPKEELPPGGVKGILEETLPGFGVRQDVILDILIRNGNIRGELDGLTVDISQNDAAGKEKAHWRVWIDTSAIGRGPGTQVTETLEDVSYEEGDGFHAEVRRQVPLGERGEYPEFTPAS